MRTGAGVVEARILPTLGRIRNGLYRKERKRRAVIDRLSAGDKAKLFGGLVLVRELTFSVRSN